MSAEGYFFVGVGLFGLAYNFIIYPQIQAKNEEKLAEHFRRLDQRLDSIDKRNQNQPSQSSNHTDD